MESQPHEYTISKTRALGKLVKAEMQKLKQIKKIRKSQEHEVREVTKSIETILENTIDLMSQEDAVNFLTKKLKEFGIENIAQKQNDPDPIIEQVIEAIEEKIIQDAEDEAAVHRDSMNDMIKESNLSQLHSHGVWQKLGDGFTDVSISQDGVFWAIGNIKISYAGNAIYYYDQGTWVKIDGEATRIAAYKNGEIWTVNEAGCVYQRDKGVWIKRAEAGTADDISIGTDGSVWITCAQEMKNKDTHIMYFDFSNEKFMKAKGFGKEIAVNSSGEPIIVLENGEIVHKVRSDMIKIMFNGYARDISISPTNDLWIVSEEKIEGGYQVYKTAFGTSLPWENMEIGATRISSWNDKIALIVNEYSEIYASTKHI